MRSVKHLATRVGLSVGFLWAGSACDSRATKPSETASSSSPAALGAQGTAGTGAATAAAVGSGDAPSASSNASADSFRTDVGELRVVPIEHGSLRLDLGDKSIYVDPADAKRFEGAKVADIVLITDIHGDHFDEAALAKIVGPGTQVLAPPVVADKYGRAVRMKNGDRKELLGVGIEAIPMYNLQRGPSAGHFYHDKGRGNGYVLTFAKTRVYVSGDTECTPEMRGLRDIDVAFVCMNLPYTMPPDEAAACVNAFRPKVVYPYHYRGSDLSVFQKAVTAPGVEVRLRDWYR